MSEGWFCDRCEKGYQGKRAVQMRARIDGTFWVTIIVAKGDEAGSSDICQECLCYLTSATIREVAQNE